MEGPMRVRVVFEDHHVLRKSQRKEGLTRCWLLLKPGLATISDLAAHLCHCFDLQRSCPDGLLLSVDGFILPSFESTCIIKDKDIINVRKKGSAVREFMNVCDNAHHTEDYDIVEKEPIFTSDKVLAIKEFAEELGGCKSEDEDDACDLPENAVSVGTPLSENANSKRKREHSKKLLRSKKKLKPVSLEEPTNSDVGIDLDFEKSKFYSEKCGHSKKNLHRKVKPINQDVELHMKTAYPIDDNDENMHNSAGKEERRSPVKENSEIGPCESPGIMKKFPSRTARRKKAKRRWLRELANSQKHEHVQNQNPAIDMHRKPQECEEVGLNGKHEGMNQNGDHKEMDQNNNLNKEMDQNNGHQKRDKNSEREEMDWNNMHQEMDENINMNEELIPIIVRPGHIRFEPIEEQGKRKSQGQVETLQWNGTTSKKKGQKWGREKSSFRTNDGNVCNGDSNEKIVVEDLEMVEGHVNFEKLMPLDYDPKEGDVIAYRLVELSSSWCPELSPFRVGKVTSYDSRSNKIIIVPVPGYLIFSREKKDEESMSEQNISLYKEDGSLEIDFPSLVDVRLFQLNESETDISNNHQNDKILEVAPVINSDLVLSGCTGNETVGFSTEKGADMSWEQIKQALEEKKSQLLKKDGQSSCSPKYKPSSSRWSYRALRGSALGPTISLLRAKNDL